MVQINYDGMSVDEILHELVLCRNCPIDSPLLAKQEARGKKLVVALRRVIIREASVKIVKKPKKKVQEMSKSARSARWHWQNDSYPN